MRSDGVRGARRVPRQGEEAAGLDGHREARVGGHALEPFEAELAGDRIRQPAGIRSQRRGAEAGDEFHDPPLAAQHLLALEEQHAQAGAAELRGRHEAVCPGADHGDVVGGGAHAAAFKISSAASRPDAPMMPPPGCVPAPHCQ